MKKTLYIALLGLFFCFLSSCVKDPLSNTQQAPKFLSHSAETGVNEEGKNFVKISTELNVTGHYILGVDFSFNSDMSDPVRYDFEHDVDGPYNITISGTFQLNTTYYYRLYVDYNSGYYETYSSVGSFIMPETRELPVVTTSTPVSIDKTSAYSGGNVTNDGGADITARGVCWSRSSYPTIADDHTSNGTGTGEFSSYMADLTPDTEYYVRAYAENAIGISYGEILSFTTLPDIKEPTVTTATVTGITKTEAVAGGEVTSTGGASVTSRGVCWSSTSSNPTLSDSYMAKGSGTGTFSCTLTSLTPGTKYYVRAYATNYVGTSYGDVVSFTTKSDTQEYTLVDYLGTWKINCMLPDGAEEWNDVIISERTNLSDGDDLNVFISGIRDGKSFHCAWGRWDDVNKRIVLQGGYYNSGNTFYSTSEPDILYYSTFTPVYLVEDRETFYWLGGGDNDWGEAALTKNSDGTISFSGTTPDENSRVANGYTMRYFLAETGEYSSYFNACWDITFTFVSASTSGAQMPILKPVKTYSFPPLLSPQKVRVPYLREK